MKKLNIVLKTESIIEIRDFEEINYISAGPKKLTDDLSQLRLIGGVTYNFKGHEQVSLLGSEISYIELLNIKDD